MDKICVMTRRRDFRGTMEFFQEIADKYKEGYEIHIPESGGDTPAFFPVHRVFMIKSRSSEDFNGQAGDQEAPEEAVESSDEVVEVRVDDSSVAPLDVQLDSLEDVESLLAFAEKEGITIPGNIKKESSMRKFIRAEIYKR